MNTQQGNKTSNLAIVSLILSVICAPIGLILGIVSLVRINSSRGALGGQGLAIAAIVIPLVMVPVMGILSAIAIPNFIRFQMRAKMSEARSMLGQIKVGQETFKTDRNTYLSIAATPASLPAALQTSWNDTPCPEACANDVNQCKTFSCIGVIAPGNVFYRYACEGTVDAFTCVAVGDLDGDRTLSAFVYASAPAGAANSAPMPELGRALCADQPISPNVVQECTTGEF